MAINSDRTLRMIALGAGCSALTAVAGLAAVTGEALSLTSVHAAPVDCTPVGVEWIDNQLYFVEKCFGYSVYRPL